MSNDTTQVCSECGSTNVQPCTGWRDDYVDCPDCNTVGEADTISSSLDEKAND